MNIGEPRRTIYIEPIEEPTPVKEPSPTEPALDPQNDPESVPA